MPELTQLTQDYFSLFGLPATYALERAQVRDTYRAMQQSFHPDRYAGKSSAEQRLAVQMSARINEAYQTLNSPIRRAEYLLRMQNQDLDPDRQRVNDMGFLQQQMELRERLGTADVIGLAALDEEVSSQIRQLGEDFASQYNAGGFEDARQTLAKMQFFDKLAAQIAEREATLDEF